jgi:hypothetical protein
MCHQLGGIDDMAAPHLTQRRGRHQILPRVFLHQHGDQALAGRARWRQSRGAPPARPALRFRW